MKPDGCKLSVLLTVHINIFRRENVTSREACFEYTAL